GRDLAQRIVTTTDHSGIAGTKLGNAVVESTLYDPPAITPIEGSLFYFQRASDKARHCGNAECDAPYFFATKKGQKYCSDACAIPAQREAKLKWWHDNRGRHKAKVGR